MFEIKDKLSMVGDFGYTESAFELNKFRKEFKLGEIPITKMIHNKVKDGPFLNVEDKNMLNYMVT